MEFLSLALGVMKDVSPGRLIESLIALGLIWSRVKPFLKKYDTRLESLEKAVTKGFEQGETRFQNIENRITKIETHIKLPNEGVLNERASEV